jgi:hypothetical protein
MTRPISTLGFIGDANTEFPDLVLLQLADLGLVIPVEQLNDWPAAAGTGSYDRTATRLGDYGWAVLDPVTDAGGWRTSTSPPSPARLRMASATGAPGCSRSA